MFSGCSLFEPQLQNANIKSRQQSFLFSPINWMEKVHVRTNKHQSLWLRLLKFAMTGPLYFPEKVICVSHLDSFTCVCTLSMHVVLLHNTRLFPCCNNERVVLLELVWFLFFFDIKIFQLYAVCGCVLWSNCGLDILNASIGKITL